jgi:hypothetical protein
MHSAVAVLCDSCVDVIGSIQCGLSPECSHSHTRLPVHLAARRRPRQNVFVTTLSHTHTHTHPHQMPPTTPHIPLIHLSSLACVYALHRLALTFITSVVSARCNLNQSLLTASRTLQSAFFIPSIHSVVWLACLHLCECARPPSPTIMQRRMMRMTTYPCHSPSDFLRLHPPA